MTYAVLTLGQKILIAVCIFVVSALATYAVNHFTDRKRKEREDNQQ